MVLTDGRAAHMHGVAEYMYKKAPSFGLDPKEMFLLGYLHDIGHIINTTEDTNVAGGMFLASSGYKNAYTVLCHKKLLTPDDITSLKLQLLTEADMRIGMDGRDIGTVVLPDAQVKVYLTASVEERARRRYLENVEAKKRGVPKTEEDLNLELIKKDIAARDDQDMHREVAPLKRAEDAVLIDSSDMTIDEVVDAILDLVKKAGYVPEGK